MQGKMGIETRNISIRRDVKIPHHQNIKIKLSE
jgi:hypothetical protein